MAAKMERNNSQEEQGTSIEVDKQWGVLHRKYRKRKTDKNSFCAELPLKCDGGILHSIFKSFVQVKYRFTEKKLSQLPIEIYLAYYKLKHLHTLYNKLKVPFNFTTRITKI